MATVQSDPSARPPAQTPAPTGSSGVGPLCPADFDTIVDGQPVTLCTLRNRRGMVVCITNYGARIEQVVVPDRDGRAGDVVQGYPTIARVRAGQTYMGAFIGRYANRIAGGRFRLDGIEHRLTINDVATDAGVPRRNTLHGGLQASYCHVFAVQPLSPAAVRMSTVFPDGQDGFPGTLPVRVTYSINERNELWMTYDAVAVGAATVASFTNHAYFNLSGDLGSPIGGHLLDIPAGRVLEIDAALVPTGRLRAVDGTPLDFRRARPIGQDIDDPYDLLALAGGYDHHFAIDAVDATDAGVPADARLRRHATVTEPVSGRTLQVWSTEPGVQFYSGNFLTGQAPRDVGKGGAVFARRSAFCLEPSRWPDSPNHPAFPDTALAPGQWMSGATVYRFGVQGRDDDAPPGHPADAA